MQVSARNIHKNFGSVAALVDINVEIEPGQVMVLLGANGAGKTTFLRCLAGIIVPTSGQILFDGQPLSRHSVEQKRRFHFLPDQPIVFPEATLIRHLAMALELYKANNPLSEQRLVGLLEDFDLLPLVERRMSKLSRGQLYKAGLVAMMAVDPDMWMLDEPFASGMDPRGLMAFRRHAMDAAQRGRTVVYSTQILDVAERLSDRYGIFHRGNLCTVGETRDLHDRLGRRDGALEQVFAELQDDPT